MIKMIVTDLDETLLHTQKFISDYTVSVLNRCRVGGLKIVFASARSTQAASAFLKQFTPDVYIGYGGALALTGDIVAGGTVVWRSAIPEDVGSRLIGDCLREPEITSVQGINESVALTNRVKEGERHYSYYDFSQGVTWSFLKVSVRATEPGAVERVAARYPMCDMLRYTGEDLYRFANREAVKWNAVAATAAYYGIGTDETAAFGDDMIDLEMIRNCGAGVAMENAVSGVKAVARYLCDTNDRDGVAKWLEEHVL